MPDNRIPFSKSAIEALPPANPGKRKYYYDTKVEGLGLSVTDGGGKSFIVYRWVKGKPERITLGKYHPDAEQDEEFESNPLCAVGRRGIRLDVEQARRVARAVVSELSAGKNPNDKKKDPLRKLTFDRLFDLYTEQYAKLYTKTWQDNVDNFKRYFQNWVGKEVLSITQFDIQIWINELGADSGKHTANRNYDTMRAVYGWGIRKGLVPDRYNPCIGVDRFKTRARERFVLPGDEYQRLVDAIDQEKDALLRDFFWMCLFTGARKSNVMAMRWDQINFDVQSWTIPDTKNGDSHAVSLTVDALALLQKRKQKAKDEWVFSSHGVTGHLISPKTAWKRIIKRAKIENLRIHDLRRTVGSYMAIQGVSPTIIGKALGHKSLQATAVYARLTQDPVRKALEDVQGALKDAGKLFPEKTSNVVALQNTG